MTFGDYSARAVTRPGRHNQRPSSAINDPQPGQPHYQIDRMLVATLGFRLGERRCPQICDRPRIFAKLALRDRAAAIVYVSDRGIVTPRYRS